MEHQRALELQLQEQKAKKEREAAEALLQERLEEQRIEQERIRLQRIYEDELASRKNAAVNHQVEFLKHTLAYLVFILFYFRIRLKIGLLMFNRIKQQNYNSSVSWKRWRKRDFDVNEKR